ncbi:MAG: phage portal protein [Mobiluncus sp.]|uniref:phage portal protein n=1 Tax=Mobiluncus sp. TaxID=47293 RepID=UPI002585468D|nr:phage portal protein [Mobiluncus sp.]MCI6584465.1 phage portal protein [Mobiluncus sp.]
MKWFPFKRENVVTNPAIVPPAREAYTALSPRQAMGLEAVYRALSILETAAKQLTIDAWRGKELIDPPPSLVRRPNIGSTQSRFIVETVASLAQRGNAYWLITRAPHGQVLTLDVLPPLEVTPKQDPQTKIIDYTYGGQIYSSREICHLKLLTIAGQAEGLGPIQAARQNLAGAIALAKYASGLVDGGGIPSGILTSEQQITQAQAKETRDEWNATQGIGKGIAVLGKGTKFQVLSLKPEEIQFLQTQNFNVTQVARLFGIPARLMLAPLEGTSTTYANAQQEDLQMVKWTLMAYLREIESALSDILPHGTTARFNLDALLRTDTLTRYQAHQIGINAGFLTIDEVRAIEGLQPLTHEESEIINA